MKTNLIAISGKMKHGKDTLADYIKNELSNKLKQKDYSTYYNQSGKVVEKISFSDPIKEAVWKIFPDLTKEDLWGSSQHRSKVIENYINPLTGNDLTIRDCLTSLGSWGRARNVNCWVEASIKKANNLIKRNRFVIIPDCRYKNEKEAIQKNNGIVIRVIRPDVGATTQDPSEIDLDDVPLNEFDFVVYNTSLDSLKDFAKNLVSQIEL